MNMVPISLASRTSFPALDSHVNPLSLAIGSFQALLPEMQPRSQQVGLPAQPLTIQAAPGVEVPLIALEAMVGISGPDFSGSDAEAETANHGARRIQPDTASVVSQPKSAREDAQAEVFDSQRPSDVRRPKLVPQGRDEVTGASRAKERRAVPSLPSVLLDEPLNLEKSSVLLRGGRQTGEHFGLEINSIAKSVQRAPTMPQPELVQAGTFNAKLSSNGAATPSEALGAVSPLQTADVAMPVFPRSEPETSPPNEPVREHLLSDSMDAAPSYEEKTGSRSSNSLNEQRLFPKAAFERATKDEAKLAGLKQMPKSESSFSVVGIGGAEGPAIGRSQTTETGLVSGRAVESSFVVFGRDQQMAVSYGNSKATQTHRAMPIALASDLLNPFANETFVRPTDASGDTLIKAVPLRLLEPHLFQLAFAPDSMPVGGALTFEQTGAALLAPTDFVGHRLEMAKEDIWLDQMAKDIVSASTRQDRLSFHLAPRILGRLDVELQQSDAGVTVQITAVHDAARQILTIAQPRLVEELRTQGIRVAESQVLSERFEQNDGQQQRSDPHPTRQQLIEIEPLVGEHRLPESNTPAPGRYA